MLEVRLIISDAEITESRVKNASRCNPLEMRQGAPKQNYIRSLFRDEETRTLLLSKFHTEMRKYAKNIELQEVFKGEKVFYQDNAPNLDNQAQAVQVFECLPDTVDPAELIYSKDIIIEEKGKEHFESMIEKRRQADEARRQREEELARQQEVPTIVIKQQAQQFSRSQSRHTKRKDRYHLKDFAESINAIQLELQTLRASKLRTLPETNRDEKIDLVKIKAEDQPTRNHCSFKRFKRYIEWFRERIVVKEEDGVQTANQKMQKSDESKFEPASPDVFFQGQDFTITLIKRNLDIIKQQQQQAYKAQQTQMEAKAEFLKHKEKEVVVKSNSKITPPQNVTKFGIRKDQPKVNPMPSDAVTETDQ